MTGIHLDDHLVAHDCVVVGLAFLLGAVAALASDSELIGMATTALLIAAGIGLLRIRAIRRTVNRLALTLKGSDR